MDRERFERNIRRWARTMPKEAAEIAKVEVKRVRRAAAKGGLPNLLIEREGESYPLHDPEGVLEEAKRWSETLDLSKSDLLFVYGVGLGYYRLAVKEWLWGKRGRYLVFIEDDPEVVAAFMETEDAEELLSDSQVRLFYIPSFKNGVASLSEIASQFMGLPFKISAIQLYLRQKAPRLMRLHTILSFLMKMNEVVHEELRTFSVPFFLNYYLNLFSLPSSYLSKELFGKWKDIPAIICGAGPSLVKNIDLLKGLGERALIFAGSTSMNALNAAGITPHLGVGIDPNPAQLMRIVTSRAYQVPYFVSYRMNSYALRAIHGDHIYVSSNATYEVAGWVDRELGIAGKRVMEGYNVVNFALSLATALGCNPIVVVGVDLAYKGDSSYAPLTPNHPLYAGGEGFMSKGPQEDLLSRKDIFGEPVFTLWKWLLESVWYSKFALEFPNLELINATEGGIGFPGVENSTLAEVAKSRLVKRFDLAGLVHASIQAYCQMDRGVTHEKIASLLARLQESLKRSASLCKELSAEYKALIERIAEEKNYPESLVTGAIAKGALALDGEVGYEEILSLYSLHLMKVMKKELQKLELDKDWLSKGEVDQEIAEMHSARFKLLGDAAEKNCSLIDNALTVHKRQHEREAASGKGSAPSGRGDSGGDKPPPRYSLDKGRLHIADKEYGLAIDEPFEAKALASPFSLGGGIAVEGYQLEGELHGPVAYRNGEGELLSRCWYYRGVQVGRRECYYSGGGLYSATGTKEGLPHGRHEYFYRGGTLRSEISYDRGALDGPLRLYYENGALKREIHYSRGLREGKETLWNYSGQLIGEFHYADDSPVGVGKFWNEAGQLQKEVTYSEGKKEPSIKLFNEKGEELVIPEEQGKDYFDIVALKLEKFTKSLLEVTKSIENLGPILEREQPESGTFRFSELKGEVERVKGEVANLLKLNEKMKAETGLDESSDIEPIWKTPTMQQTLHALTQEMVEKLQAEMSHIQNGFVDILNAMMEKRPTR